MNKTKELILLAILMSLQIVISFFYIPVFDNSRIYFTYIIIILVSRIVNLRTALLYATIEDIVAFMINPTGPFFIGYTITAICAMLIYNLCLYNKYSIKRVIIAKTLVNVLVNITLNSLWSSILFSKGYIFYLSKAFIKNIGMLPIEIMIIIVFYKLLNPILVKYKLVSKDIN